MPDACARAQQAEFGAPDEGFGAEQVAEAAAQAAQSGALGRGVAETVMNSAISVIEGLFDKATKASSDLWLTKAARAIFMSYFVELPDLDTAGLIVNLDLIGFVPAEQAQQYPSGMLKFFADIEQAWVGLGGMPHNGKMYGFYDPRVPGSATAPFNPGFLAEIARRRSERIAAFEEYRRTRDPNGVFLNGYVRALLGHSTSSESGRLSA